jgi:putative transcriptional regulator
VSEGETVQLRNRLRELRARYDLTQEALAADVGVTRQTVIAIERGDYSPSVFLALRLAHRLQVSVNELFWLEDQDGPKGVGVV